MPPAADTNEVPERVLTVWLAGPEARERFDPEAQRPEDHARWQRLTSERRRRDWEVSRALIAGAQPGNATLSLSHSNGYAALAVAGSGIAIGVDIEHFRERDCLRLARPVFDPRETAGLASLSGQERLRHFYVLWTLKEALAKALGLELLAALRGCVVLRTAGGWSVELPADPSCAVWVFHPRPDLVLSVAAVARGEPARAVRLVTREWPVPAGHGWIPVMAVDHESRRGLR